MDNLQNTLNAYLESDFIKKIRAVREGRYGLNLVSGMRNLTPEEIKILKQQNNSSTDWTRILVSHDFIPDHINGCRFLGDCHLGRFDGSPADNGCGVLLPCGVFDSVINNSVLCGSSAIYRCGIISNYIISGNCTLYSVNSITAGTGLCFGSGRVIPAGPETGERGITIFAEMNMGTAEVLVSSRSADSMFSEFILKYKEACMLNCGFIDGKCIIRDTVSVSDSFIGGGAALTGAVNISGSAVLSSCDEPVHIGHGADIRDSIIQYGCSVDSGAYINSSLLMEHSEAEKKCIISSSIIGPNSSIGEGEITSAVAGPFTAAHHQSLLIACIWTAGRGNIGYGANVGSNHTSRQPDQELFPAEGMFFGLGCSVKYPADFRLAPYSVISTGVVTLPQRMEFPFSLITQPSVFHKEVPAMYNELKPAWLLSENLYTLVRNENKYRKRNRAHRDNFDFTILRPEIVSLMKTARSRLLGASGREIFTDRDIAGTGKNFITAAGVNSAIESYSFFIMYYALRLYARRTGRLIAGGKAVSDSLILEDDPGTRWWNHAKGILETEGLAANTAGVNMQMFIDMTERVYSKTLSSRRRDYERGSAIFEDYSLYHGLPENDPVIKDLRDRTAIEISRAEQIISVLK